MDIELDNIDTWSEELRSIIRINTTMLIDYHINDVVERCYDINKKFLSFAISNVIERPEPPFNFDLSIKRDVYCDEVIEIIEYSDKRFKNFTTYREI